MVRFNGGKQKGAQLQNFGVELLVFEITGVSTSMLFFGVKTSWQNEEKRVELLEIQ